MEDATKSEEIIDSRNCPFELLPRELVWSIFDFVPETVFSLRSVSHTFQSLVDSYARMRVRIPLVDKIIVNTATAPDEISITIGMPEKETNFMFFVDQVEEESLSKTNLLALRLRLNPATAHVTKQIPFDGALHNISQDG
ncbi:hypothetical protein PENTCL1PPCAC_9769 [Pristionchus entomophagus]|uniref:F-box domain-containing protein n=1 Tax=Pristionchus entomophagus TaxID=358040 RepID=A0AAV5T4Y9_9BILA|nr:hypothetical protein PENTCL1PPCAC_9769 [Pristionchus entomophagus]